MSEPPGTLGEMHILRPRPRLPALESPGGVPAIRVLTRPLGDADGHEHVRTTKLDERIRMSSTTIDTDKKHRRERKTIGKERKGAAQA